MNAKEKKAIEVLANITGYYEEIIYLDLDSCGVTFREAIKAMQAYANQRMPSEEELICGFIKWMNDTDRANFDFTTKILKEYIRMYLDRTKSLQQENEETENLSPCCGAEIIHHDICSQCKEHI